MHFFLQIQIQYQVYGICVWEIAISFYKWLKYATSELPDGLDLQKAYIDMWKVFPTEI